MMKRAGVLYVQQTYFSGFAIFIYLHVTMYFIFFFSQLMFISQRTQKAKPAVAEADSFHVGWSMQI